MSNTQIVLVVDDEQSLLKALAEKLVVEGFNVLKANNGSEGLEISCQKKQI